MKRYLRPLVFCLALLVACDVPFSPKGEYSRRIVVYGILDGMRSPQYVRVYSTYDVGGVNPAQNTADTQVRNASVAVYDASGNRFVFKDTLLSRDATDRYGSDVTAYSATDLVPLPGYQYKLLVTVPEYGQADATLTVPEPFLIFVNGSRTRPLLADTTSLCNCIQVSLFGGGGAKGQLTRFFVDYSIEKPGGEEINFRQEVPLSIRRHPDGTEIPVFPEPDRELHLEFSRDLFFKVVEKIQASDPSAQIKVEEVTFISYALDPNLYNYYLIAHGFGDPYSVRLDSPDFTNIQNGLGVFGALTLDSLKLPIR